MSIKHCPLLRTQNARGEAGPPLDYPSFEHQCQAVEELPAGADPMQGSGQLLLADQATYCLGGNHPYCPRFRLLHPAAGGEEAALLAGESGLLLPDLALAEDPQPIRVGMRFWAGVGALLVVFMLCGGSVALYAGWQLVGQGLVSLSVPGSEPATPPTPERIVLMATATPDPSLVQSTAPGVQQAAQSPLPSPQPADQAPSQVGQPVVITTPTPDFAFPEAVTPTPQPISPESGLPLIITTPERAPGQDPSPGLATAVAGPLVISPPGQGIATPTRRPTPEGDASPVGVPDAQGFVVVTATPTPDIPSPTVSFRAAHQSLPPNDCTILYWEVENARAVFFDGEGVMGKDQRRVCLRDQGATYRLDVLDLNGVQESHRVTVQVVPYTPTPTVTPTMTPVLTPTPTWTPLPGSVSTPAPPSFGVSVVADAGNQRFCPAGQPCEVSVRITNTGNLADEIFVDLGKSGPWSAALCRTDGLCAETSLSLGIGPGDDQAILLRVQLPEGSAGAAHSFTVSAASGNANRTVQATPLVVTVYSQ